LPAAVLLASNELDNAINSTNNHLKPIGVCFIMVLTTAWVALPIPSSAGFLAGVLPDIPNKDS
jgi:hypothetical protein